MDKRQRERGKTITDKRQGKNLQRYDLMPRFLLPLALLLFFL